MALSRWRRTSRGQYTGTASVSRNILRKRLFMQTRTVEVLINVTQDEDSKIDDGKPEFSGEYVLRALNAAGSVLRKPSGANRRW